MIDEQSKALEVKNWEFKIEVKCKCGDRFWLPTLGRGCACVKCHRIVLVTVSVFDANY